VRHAEKTKPLAGMSVIEANDPPLSDSGNLRALALKERLMGENIRHIFSTNYRRTLNTAKPLDEYLLGVQTELYSPKKDSAAAFIEKLKAIKKGNVLVVGHSNTIDDIANQLCGKTVVPGDLKETDYDNLFKI
jgi:broad specificity phosphatase PhoE